MILKRIIAKLFAGLINLAHRLKMLPFDSEFGTNRGGSISRYYVDQFMQKHGAKVQGKILEFGSKKYKEQFSLEKITTYDVMDIVKHEEMTVHGDLQNCPQIPNDSYDAIICTQVLEHIYEIKKALSELYRILKPGGVLIVTLPFNGGIHGDPSDYWRVTPYAFEALVAEYRFTETDFTAGGNLYTSTMYHLGLGMADAGSKLLETAVKDSEPLNIMFCGKKLCAE